VSREQENRGAGKNTCDAQGKTGTLSSSVERKPPASPSISREPPPKAAPSEPTAERATSLDLASFTKGAADGDRACLVMIYGPEMGRRVSLVQPQFEIGRSSRCDLTIDQESISRHHARVSLEGRQHSLEDLASTNGTFVNDARISRHVLRDGDQIKIGRSILKYFSGDSVESSYHEEIYKLMTIDALTQTHNRRHFDEMLDREFSRSLRYRRPLSLILFDIDRFKAINDSYGHVAGDSVLRQLAAVIKARLRQQDCLARVGGEEFAALLPEVDLAGARIVAEKVRGVVETSTFPVESKTLACTVSVGVATCGPHVTSPRMLYELADRSLYTAKNEGRNRVCG